MKIKKLLSVLLAGVMLITSFGLTSFAANVQAAAATSSEPFTYTVTSHSVYLKWSNTGADKYAVYIQLREPHKTFQKKVCETTKTSYLADYLDSSTSYTFGLQTIKDGVASEIAWQSIRTKVYDSAYTLPEPSKLSKNDIAFSDDGQKNLTLTWKTDAKDASALYQVNVYSLNQRLRYYLTEKNTATVLLTGVGDIFAVYGIEIIAFRGNLYGCDGYYQEVDGGTGTVIYKDGYVAKGLLHEVTNVKAASTATTVTLTWSMPEKYVYDYFLVEMYKGGKWVTLAKPTAMKYTVKNLQRSTAYKFRITSRTNTKEIYSDFYKKNYEYYGAGKPVARSVKTKEFDVGKIANLKASTTKSAVTLSWSKNSSAKYYKVFAVKNGKYTQLTKTKNNSTVKYTASNLAANTSYKFRVTAYNASNQVIARGDITAKTCRSMSNLKATRTRSAVTLTWSKFSSAAYYKVFEYKDGKYTQLAKTTKLAYSATGLKSNSTHTYLIKAYNSANTCFAYSYKTVKTFGYMSNLKATRTRSSVKLTWNKNASAAYYKVFEYKNGKYTQVAKTTKLAFTATGLKANSTHKYLVRAYNSANKYIAYSYITSKTLK